MTASHDAAGQGEYRKYLPDLSIARFTTMKTQNAHDYARNFKEQGGPPWLHALWLHWRQLLNEPYKGVTNDGHIQPGLFKVQDEGVEIEKIVEATNKAVSLLDDKQVSKISNHIDSPEWRTWSNPEFLLSDKGVRLDELNPQAREAIMKVLQSTLSPEGYQKAISAMRINGFLGELVQTPAVVNEFSYNFVLFGVPSTTAPWGYSFYGHHLCLNIFFYRHQIVISPWFTGAEPNEIDAGTYKGTAILRREEALGLKLMQSLEPDFQRKAQIYKQMKDPAMAPGRWNRDDQRHLCGAYRDNRVVPYEGILVAALPSSQQDIITEIIDEYFLFLPSRARQMRLDEAKAHFRETHFCWIGGFTDTDPFYYRIQSPVIIVEFDHHSGVFLNNEHPAKFHVHTLLRTPNGGDYGMALRPLIPPQVEQDWVWDEDKKSVT